MIRLGIHVFTSSIITHQVFVPRKCNGRTTWCEDGGPDENGVTKVGCDDFVEQCTDVEHWGGDGSKAIELA